MLGKARKSRRTGVELGGCRRFAVRAGVAGPGRGRRRGHRGTTEVPTRPHFRPVDAVSRKLQLRHIAETKSRRVPQRTHAVRQWGTPGFRGRMVRYHTSAAAVEGRTRTLEHRLLLRLSPSLVWQQMTPGGRLCSAPTGGLPRSFAVLGYGYRSRAAYAVVAGVMLSWPPGWPTWPALLGRRPKASRDAATRPAMVPRPNKTSETM